MGFPPELPLPPEELAWVLLAPIAGRGLGFQDDPPRAVLYLPQPLGPWLAAVRQRAQKLGLVPPGWPGGYMAVSAASDQDWAEMWKVGFDVVRIGRLAVTPSWVDFAPGPRDRVVRLEPGMAFGTGTHATTYGCLEQLEAMFSSGRLRPGCRMLDVGTGSGILALAALALGAGEAWGIDADGVALANAAGNARLSGLERGIHLVQGLFPDAARGLPPADLVTANLDPLQLRRLAADIRSATVPGGCVVMSGFTPEDVAGLLAAYPPPLWNLIGRSDRDGWAGLVLQRTTAARG